MLASTKEEKINSFVEHVDDGSQKLADKMEKKRDSTWNQVEGKSLCFSLDFQTICESPWSWPSTVFSKRQIFLFF